MSTVQKNRLHSTHNELDNDDIDMEQFSPDWQLIDEISIKLLESGVGTFETLQRALPSVVLAQIEHIVPDHEPYAPNSASCSGAHLLKLFRLAQMQIDYLLTSQQSLVERVERAESRASRFRKENRVLRDQFFGIEDRERKRHSCGGADGETEGKVASAQWGKELFRCNECSKVFLHANFLADHLLRKHHTGEDNGGRGGAGSGAKMGGSLRRLVGAGSTKMAADATAGVVAAGEMMASGANKARRLIRRGNSQQEGSKKRYSKRFGLTKQSTTTAADYFFSSSIGEEILDENLGQEKLSSESSLNTAAAWR